MNDTLFVTVYSDTGIRKTINQDNFFLNGKMLRSVNDKDCDYKVFCEDGVFAVCDGMGGESDGEIASRIAVEEIGNMYENVRYPEKQHIFSVIDEANRKMCDIMHTKGEKMGSTMALATINKRQLSVYNVGDSKCYLINKNGIQKLTKDHTLIAQMIESGMMTEEQAKTDRRRHQLVQHLGIFPDEMTLSPHCTTATIEPDDVILLCSDGISDTLDETALTEIIARYKENDDLAYELVSQAKSKGSTDNITAMVIKVRENPLRKIRKIIYALSALSCGLLGMLSACFILLFRLLNG